MLGINRIYNEDCIGEKGMCLIPDQSIDMILCDLPYGTTAQKWDSVIPLDILWKQYRRVIKPNGCIALCGTEPFSSLLRISNLDWYKYDWIWEKGRASGFVHAKNKPLKAHENISIFSPTVHKNQSKKRMVYNPIMEEGKPYYPRSVLRFSMHNVGNLHPTQKPIDLFEYLIRTYTNDGDLVLDNCMGSATTAIAAINTNRNFIGFELEREYFDLAQIRIATTLGL